MKADSGKPAEEPGAKPGSVQQEERTCPVCGTKFYATAESGFCPVCILHGAVGVEATATNCSRPMQQSTALRLRRPLALHRVKLATQDRRSDDTEPGRAIAVPS